MSTLVSPTKDNTDDPDVSGGKTLSRTLLYAPLAAYNNDNNDDDDKDDCSNVAAYLASRNALPKNIQEKGMVEFWHKVGLDFHRYRATTKDSKNNGSRPSSLKETEDRMRQRAITLVGGGINKPTAATRPAMTTSRQPTRKRKRFVVQPNVPLDDDAGTINAFLIKLNALWNEYISEVLQLQQKLSPVDNIYNMDIMSYSPAFASRASATLSSATTQLVGAQVCVKACAQQLHRVGTKGYLVGMTTNTWHVIILTTTRAKRRRRKKIAERQQPEMHTPGGLADPATNVQDEPCVSLSKKDPSQNKGCTSQSTIKATEKGVGRSWEVGVIPKQGTVLSLLIPLVGDENKTDADESHGSERLDTRNSHNIEPGARLMLVVDLQL